jgi:hypothetical protein
MSTVRRESVAVWQGERRIRPEAKSPYMSGYTNDSILRDGT